MMTVVLSEVFRYDSRFLMPCRKPSLKGLTGKGVSKKIALVGKEEHGNLFRDKRTGQHPGRG